MTLAANFQLVSQLDRSAVNKLKPKFYEIIYGGHISDGDYVIRAVLVDLKSDTLDSVRSRS